VAFDALCYGIPGKILQGEPVMKRTLAGILVLLQLLLCARGTAERIANKFVELLNDSYAER
jgi:hypothetical protein